MISKLIFACILSLTLLSSISLAQTAQYRGRNISEWPESGVEGFWNDPEKDFYGLGFVNLDNVKYLSWVAQTLLRLGCRATGRSCKIIPELVYASRMPPL